MALVFGCTEAQKEAVKAKLFDITGSPALGDYTKDVGIIASADMTTLNVDYTGLNLDEEISRFGAVEIFTYFYSDTTTRSNSYTDAFYWDASQDQMFFSFSTSSSMLALPQYNAQHYSTSIDDMFKFSTPLTCEEVNVVTPLAIKRMVVSLTYIPDLMNPTTYTKYSLEGDNSGYGALTLIGYSSTVNGMRVGGAGESGY